ncbi:MAG: DUF4177 domain-containing protein [Clostridia bacterium]|nr:DUF4177 domain-containing protein [Clostridia bacterium]
MESWEYRVIKYDTEGFLGGKIETSTFERELNDLGGQGWELVSCFDTSMSYGQTRHVVAVFKRRC